MTQGLNKLIQLHGIAAGEARKAKSDITRERHLLKAKYYREMIDLHPWTETTIRKVYG